MAKKEPELVGEEATVETVSTSSIDRLTAAIEAMVAMQMQRPSGDVESKALMEGLTSALARVSDNQLAGAQLIANSHRQVHRPSNEVVHMKSVFDLRGNPSLHPEGSTYEKPRLVCECRVPFPELPADNMLTREEVELLNIVVKIPGVYHVKRIDDTKIKGTVKVDHGVDDVTPTRMTLAFETAFNNEYFRLMPPLHSQLRQIIGQHSDESIRAAARLVLTMEEEELLIRAGKLSVAA